MNCNHPRSLLWRRLRNHRQAPKAIRLGICLLVAALGLTALIWTNPSQPWFTRALAQTAPPTTHTVQSGETLSQIAEKYSVAINVLMFYNGISDPNDIYVGQELQLPPPATPTPADAYTVKAGETLSQIAEAHQVTLAALMALNGITDPNAIYRGQILRLPSSNASTGTATVKPTGTTTSPSTGSKTQTATSTATATPSNTPQSTATAATTYVVQAGETLSQIAEAHDIALDKLMQLNGISNPNAIYAGQVLSFTPPTVTTTPTATNTASPTTTASPTETEAPTNTEVPTDPATPDTTQTVTSTATTSASAEISTPIGTPTEQSLPQPIASLNQIYTVGSGDSLQLIALRMGVDLEALRKLNHLTPQNMNWLSVGTTLTLPATGDQLHFVKHEEQQQYVVQPGDSLGRIAEKFDRSLTEMLLANRISNPNAIYPGQSLTVPDKKPENTTDATDKVQVGPLRNGFYYYTVQKGDTMSSLAEQFDSTKLAILDYNNLPDESTVYLGMELRIPFGPPLPPVRLPPAPNSGTRFLVSLSRQQCWVFQGNRILHIWSCSTGYGEWKTRTGTFAVQSKFEMAKSQAYQLDMPFWLGIYNVGTYENGIHGLPIRWDTGKKIWTHLIGKPATFGCAMLDDDNAAKLYKLAYVGMQVFIVN